MLKTIQHKDYLIKELTIGQYLPIMRVLADDTAQAQLDMLALSVCDNLTGEPVGVDGLNQIGASEFLPLWEAVAELHGLIEKKD
jgi:hypothetical protein